MNGFKAVLLTSLVLTTTGFTWFWIATERRRRKRPSDVGECGEARLRGPSLYEVLIGSVTDFLDTLGIGSFATTTPLLRLRGVVPDECIPGTLNVGHALPTLAQALVYISIVRVNPRTLALMIAAAAAGAYLGAGVVARWPKRNVQLAMGAGLFAAAGLMLAQEVDLVPRSGETLGLDGSALAAGIFGNFVLGALMTVGIGLYAPCMILVGLLGMNLTAAFPIMMGSCAFLMPVAGLRFIAQGAYGRSAALGLTMGGVPAVFVAAWIVRSLPLGAVRWLVIGVVLGTSGAMLRAAIREPGRSDG